MFLDFSYVPAPLPLIIVEKIYSSNAGNVVCFGIQILEQFLRLPNELLLLLFKGVVRSIFILDILKVLIPESTLLFTRTKTEQICLRYPHPPVTSPKNGFGGIRRSVAKPLQCLQL